MRIPWTTEEVYWMNPPWRLWPQVEARLQETTCSALVLCPAWRKPWVRRLLGMASRRIFYEQGTHLFELNAGPTQGIPWGVWALRIDKGPRKLMEPGQSLFKCLVHPSWRSMVEVGQSKIPELKWNARGGEPPNAVSNPTSIPPVFRVLDLFAGTGSIHKIFKERGYEIISVDQSERFRPTIVADIEMWDYKSLFKPKHFDIIFCSPPCEHYSQARTTAPRDLEQADRLVKNVLKL